MRIPFSQLRFPAAERHTFGIHAERYIQRRNESAWLVYVPKTESGLASRAGHLDGIDGIESGRSIELLPYAVTRAEFTQPSTGRSLQRRLARVRRRRPRPEVRPEQQHHAQRHHQSGFRTGRGRPCRREPHRVRDVLRGEASLLHRGVQHLQQFRAGRVEQLLGLQPVGAHHLLLAPHRAIAAGRDGGRLRRQPLGDDDSRRGEAHGQDAEQLEPRPARGRHRARVRADVDRRDSERDGNRAAHQLLRGARAARDRPSRARLVCWRRR